MLLLCFSLWAGVLLAVVRAADEQPQVPVSEHTVAVMPVVSAPAPVPEPTAPAIPVLPEPSSAKLLTNGVHVYQTFNNCGPASLAMALSYFGITQDQATLADALRPYRNQRGDNDDKSTTLEELARKALEYDFVPYARVNGDITLLRQFIAHDMPVIVRTLFTEDDDVAHYRIVKGYDDSAREIVYDDSMEGKNLRVSYDDFEELWRDFNHEYLALVPPEQYSIAETIVGEERDPDVAWRNAMRAAEDVLLVNPNDVRARFNLSIALYHTGDREQARTEFERVEGALPFRALWYQTEPVEIYLALGDYARVLSLTERILANHNKAYAELYVLRGRAYRAQGDIVRAREEFEQAVLYNKNLASARAALDALDTIYEFF